MIHHRRGPERTGFGIVTYRRGGSLGPRRQSHCQLMVVHRGRVEIVIDDEVHHLCAGDGILLEPGRTQTFRFSRRTETRHSWCEISPDEIPEEMRLPSWCYHRPARCSSWLLDFMHRGLRLCELTDEIAGRHARVSAMLVAFWEFARGLRPHSAPIETRSQPLLQAHDYIRKNLAQPMTLAAVARAAGVSKGHLINLAKQTWKMTPYEFIWSTRLQRAAQLLHDTGLSVSEIGYSVGFATPYHFSRRFQQQYRRSPRHWRQKQWHAKFCPAGA